MKPILEASSVKKLFKGRGRSLDVMALNDIDFLIYPGEVIGIVGESGSGKSTLSRILVGIEKATEGQVLHNGEAVESYSAILLRDEKKIIITTLEDSSFLFLE
jgi:ABC-type oligopeptide transport system ATPase subunit